MYHAHKNSGTSVGKEITPIDCFVERTRSWFWITMVFVFGAIVCAIVTFSEQTPAYSTAGRSFPQGGQFQNTALTVCPYCPGFLDSEGRCNVRECPIYSPNYRGKLVTSNDIPVRRVLIKELALEAGASQGKGSVIIQSIYPGGNAEKAGLQVGDRILRFNGRKVKNVKQFESIVPRAKPGSQVKIKIVRDNEKIKTTATIGEGEMAGVTIPKI